MVPSLVSAGGEKDAASWDQEVVHYLREMEEEEPNYRFKEKRAEIFKFFETEDFGIQVRPRCVQCKSCKSCNFLNRYLSHMDQMELSAIEGNLTLDEERKIWCVKLPYRVDPKILQDNRYQVICILESQEKRLKNDPELIKAYYE